MTNVKKLRAGTILSEIQVYEIVRLEPNGNIILKNDKDEGIEVTKDYAESCLVTADQYTEEKKVTRTELADIFASATSVVLTVNFNKQVKEADVLKEIEDAYSNSTPKEFSTKVKQAIKKGLSGEERTLEGIHWGSKDEFGRFRVTDLKIKKDTSKDFDVRQRLVDSRTLNHVILRGVKYVAK